MKKRKEGEEKKEGEERKVKKKRKEKKKKNDYFIFNIYKKFSNLINKIT